MRRTTIFLPDELDRRLRGMARRTRRPQAELVREALARYLEAPRRLPRSVGMGASREPRVSSENVKEWVRDQWAAESSGDAHAR